MLSFLVKYYSECFYIELIFGWKWIRTMVNELNFCSYFSWGLLHVKGRLKSYKRRSNFLKQRFLVIYSTGSGELLLYEKRYYASYTREDCYALNATAVFKFFPSISLDCCFPLVIAISCPIGLLFFWTGTMFYSSCSRGTETARKKTVISFIFHSRDGILERQF